MDNIINALETKVTHARKLFIQGSVHDPKLIAEIMTLRKTLHIMKTYENDLIETNMDID